MKIFKYLFSGMFMGILLIIFAAAIGYATFVENDYDPMTAKMVVYNARWFEILMLLMVVNFIGMIFTKRLYRKEQLNVLLIHVSLIIIIIGAAITRYIGYEGMMQLRNGQISNVFDSTDPYISIEGGGELINKKILLSGKGENFYNKTFNVADEKVDFTIKKYYDNAVEKLVRTTPGVSNGVPYLNILIEEGEHSHTAYLKNGDSKNLHSIRLSYGDTTSINDVQIIDDSAGLKIRLPLNLQATSKVLGQRTHSKFVPLREGAKYRFAGITLMLEEYIESGIVSYKPVDPDEEQGSKVTNIEVNGQEMTILFNQPYPINVNGKDMRIRIGNLRLQLPFALQLKEFQLERYPGSNSPSSFASEIILIDGPEFQMPYRIFMNNILSYKGYRFYQASYHEDEQGTVLSVNHDLWGTRVTYLGYFLLFGSLIVTFFTKKTRFSTLLLQFKKIREKRKALVTAAMLIMLPFTSSAQGMESIFDNLPRVSKEHAEAFGKLQLQNNQGRMMPLSTMAHESLVKIYKKDTYDTLSAEQVFLEMMVRPTNWFMRSIIKVGNEEIVEIIGSEGDYARYVDFFSQQGVYKLSEQVDDAYRTKPGARTKLHKELINVDERVNVYTMIINGQLLRIFPLPQHPNNTWGTPNQFEEVAGMLKMEKLYTNYIDAVIEGKETGNYQKADAVLAKIDSYQKSSGGSVLLSDSKVSLEIFYNKLNIFKRLFPIYMMLGLFLTGIFFIQTFKPAMQFRKTIKVFAAILFVGWLAHTFGLILRWYLSGHAPWSNGYESMIFIAWVTVLAGLIFMNRSIMTLAVTGLLAGITLLTAHLNWMNPEITNLVPVLKSYWLMVHVATITSSYGFLGLGAMLAFMNLCVMIFRNKKNLDRVNLIVDELAVIIEMTLMVGLALLIIGNFLGGIWANESWGRYWGWDPKETWTLVTIIIYSFILHMHLIPKVRSRFSFNFASLIGFSTVLMTYFGVNFYLSGLHSYAKGDPVPIPTFVYYLLAIITIISVLAAVNNYLMTSMKRLNKAVK